MLRKKWWRSSGDNSHKVKILLNVLCVTLNKFSV